LKEIKLNHNNSLISIRHIKYLEKKLQKEINSMNKIASNGYIDDRASINLPFDIENLEKVKKLAFEKQKFNPKYILVVGIGGSNLGTIAIQEAILGKLYNSMNPNIKIFYLDNVDSDKIANIISIIEPDLKKGENMIINAVSKSGGTTETIANFETILEVLKKYKKNYDRYVVVTTDKNSNFWKLSIDEGFDLLEIPKKIGGRFSVFSPAGLFPLYMTGINVDSLLNGARYIRDKCLNSNIKENPAALSASLIYQQRINGIRINDMFIFSSDFESIGKWYRQLIGESIGKTYNNENEKILEGITPTISIGSIDLHSVGQLYLGGPYDKFTTFIYIEKNKEAVNIPNDPKYSILVKGIQSKSLKHIMNSIYEGVKIAYKKGKRPFMEIILPDKSEESIGQFIQFKEMEIMYLGFLMNINPFNQPNVESYKIETKKILDKS
jgi:glucose-6-phosphate isomerase